MPLTLDTVDELRRELDETRARLADAEDALHAIRNGDEDGLMIAGAGGAQVFTLTGSQEPNRLLIEQMSEGAFTLSREGDILYANETLAKILKRPLSQIIGSAFKYFILPADHTALGELIKVAWNGTCRGEISAVAADRSRIPLRLGLRPVSLGTEKVLCAVATDLTEQKRAQEVIREVESSFRMLAENVPQIVWATRPDGWNIYFNQHWVEYTGLTLEESYGTGWNKPFHPDDQKRAWEAWKNATENRALYSLEARLRRKDGVYRWWLLRGEPLCDASGTIIKWFGTCTDIEDLKSAQNELVRMHDVLEDRVRERTAQLETANKELEAFSYSVSHDLRAPLRGITGYVSMLEEDYGNKLDAEGNRLLNVVSDQAKRMNRLIEDLLRFSRLGRQSMSSTTIDMTDLARDVFNELLKSSPNPAPRLELKPLPPAQGDLAMLTQVLTNLIGNAIKYSRKKSAPVIEIGGASGDNEACYYVKDNGAGFDMKYVDKLFGVFQRLHSESEFEGTGVGLALVQRIIHRHAGKVWAEGKVDEGATFHFTLPTRGSPTHE